jgi:WD40 repeat protein
VDQAVYSPAGRFAVTTSEDEKVIVWDPATEQPVEVLSGHAGPVHGVAFSGDGKTLYTSSLDGVVLGWDLGGMRRFGQPFKIGPGLSSRVFGNPVLPGTPPLALSPDGSRFAVRVGQSTVRLFSTRTLRAQGSFTIPQAEGVITALQWSPRASDLAVGTLSGALALWSTDGRLKRALTGLPSPRTAVHAVQAVAFSADGSLIAATDKEETPTAPGPPTGRLEIWRTATGSPMSSPRELPQPGDSLAFARHGSELAVGLDTGRVLILDAHSGDVRRKITTFSAADGFSVVALAFAPDGTLATGSWSGIVQLWNPATGQQLGHPVLASATPVGSISFDPSGRRFAVAGGSDGIAKIWFTSTLQQEGANLQADPGQWGNAAFTPDGQRLLVLYSDGTGFSWPATTSAWEQHACAVAGRNFTREEWNRFVSGYSYTRVCGG